MNDYAAKVFSLIAKELFGVGFTGEDFNQIRDVFTDITKLFKGNFSNYQICDTKYHDLHHTLEAVSVMVKILVGMMIKKGKISKKLAKLGIIATLLHDTGFIKLKGDDQGTGAKYTFQHIMRSIDFAGKYLTEKGYDIDSVALVQNMIKCTGAKIDWLQVGLKSGSNERNVGYALGTADLLSQMASDDYIKKLPLLFEEFQEAYKYEGIEKLAKEGIKIFGTAEELVSQTPEFCKHVIGIRLSSEFGSVFKFLDLETRKDLFNRIKSNNDLIKMKLHV